MRVDIDKLDAGAKAATQGRWRWRINLACRQVVLEGAARGFEVIMDFTRWGMNGAKPRFREDGGKMGILMTGAEKFAAIVPGREHHENWHRSVEHPDASHIAACSPDVIQALCAELRALRTLEECFRIADREAGKPANQQDVGLRAQAIERAANALRDLDALDAQEPGRG